MCKATKKGFFAKMLEDAIHSLVRQCSSYKHQLSFLVNVCFEVESLALEGSQLAQLPLIHSLQYMRVLESVSDPGHVSDTMTPAGFPIQAKVGR